MVMNYRKKVAKLYWILITQFGLDPLKLFRSLKGLPRYISNWSQFKSNYEGRMEIVPCLHDWNEEAGASSDEYFRQDLFVAREIFKNNPAKHVDIGSRIDGFVAHVASYREVEIFDVRPITNNIPGVIFKQANLMNPIKEIENYCDSLSCLHALEHFGLGRYGDPVDPHGFKSGLVNMTRLLKTDGVFYLSVPIGVDRVEFNANRVFDPRIIIDLAKKNSLMLLKLTVVYPGGVLKEVEASTENLTTLANLRYALGIFTFKKA